MFVEKLAEHTGSFGKVHGVWAAELFETEYKFFLPVVSNEVAAQLLCVCVDAVASDINGGQVDTDVGKH